MVELFFDICTGIGVFIVLMIVGASLSAVWIVANYRIRNWLDLRNCKSMVEEKDETTKP